MFTKSSTVVGVGDDDVERPVAAVDLQDMTTKFFLNYYLNFNFPEPINNFLTSLGIIATIIAMFALLLIDNSSQDNDYKRTINRTTTDRILTLILILNIFSAFDLKQNITLNCTIELSCTKKP
jgi:hypothetical protein